MACNCISKNEDVEGHRQWLQSKLQLAEATSIASAHMNNVMIHSPSLDEQTYYVIDFRDANGKKVLSANFLCTYCPSCGKKYTEDQPEAEPETSKT